jgi:hypothetical protein
MRWLGLSRLQAQLYRLEGIPLTKVLQALKASKIPKQIQCDHIAFCNTETLRDVV